MSAVKSKFAGFLRGLLRHFDDNEPVATNNDVNESAPVTRPTAAAPRPAPGRFASRPLAKPAAALATVPPPVPKPPAKVVEIKEEKIDLPLQPIIAGAAIGIARQDHRLRPRPAARFPSRLKKFFIQLATGTVKISFGELRQLAPGVFANYNGEHDARAVALPLNQILALVNPGLLARRAAQKRVDVSDEVAGPFETPGADLKISTEKAKATPPPPAEPVPLSRFAAPNSPTSAQPPPVVPPPAFAPRWTTPATTGSNGNGGSNGSKNGPARDPNGSNAPHSARPAGFEIPQPAEAPKAGNPPQVSAEPPLLVSLAVLFENWPDALKLEISQLDLENAQVNSAREPD